MSKDIRSYFLPQGRGSNKATEIKTSNSKKSHKRVCVIDSDSEEEKTPPKRPKSSSKQLKESLKGNKIIKPELKPVNVADAFGTSKIKRSATKNLPEKTDQSQVRVRNEVAFEEVHSDKDLEATLRHIDEVESACLDKKKKDNNSSSSDLKNYVGTVAANEVIIPHFATDTNELKEIKCSSELLDTEKEIKDKSIVSESNCVKKESEHNDVIIETPSKAKPTPKTDTPISKPTPKADTPTSKPTRKTDTPSTKPTPKSGTPTSKSTRKTDTPRTKPTPKSGTPTTTHGPPARKPSPESDMPISPSVDPVEKKRQHAMNYMKYLQREGPKNLGSKELPKGTPGCLSGLAFVVTGVLDSFDRDQAASLIQQYGGKVTSSVSRKTSYLIRGDEPGPSKLEKAISCGTPQLDEDGLLNLIVEKSKTSKSIQTLSGTGNKKHKLTEESDMKNSETPSKKKKEHACSDSSSNKSREAGSQESLPKIPKKGSGSSTAGETACSSKTTSPANETEAKGPTTNSRNTESSLWADKYRPTSSKQVIGQQGDRSTLRKLTTWLQNWHKNHSGNKKLPKPSPWAKNDDGAFFKAALLSGPPGIGKTTMSHVVSKELGFDVVEFNASDTRSKKLLHEEILELLSNKSLFGYFHDKLKETSIKHVLLMDEVDGMAGNEDRGGMQELILLIKGSRIPIICMCNDRNHPKIRSLVNYCFDLRVTKPRLEQIRGAMMSVCFKEGLKISSEAMTDVICGANQDMRQILNHLAMWSAKDKQLSAENVKLESAKAKKDIKIGPWDVLKKVFSADDHKTMSIHDKSDLFFYDYSLSPLFVQENYLSVVPINAKGNIIKTLDLVAQAAESISMGDIADRKIRSKNAWSLLPTQAMFSSVIPGDIMEGYLRSQISFPSWLGKNSRRNKFDRLLQELNVHMRLSTSGSKEAINLDYLNHIRDALFNPLINEGSSGVPASLSVMQEYHLLREDLEGLIEVTLWPGQKDPMSLVESKVKAALTRAYNKEGIMTPYSVTSVVKKRAVASSQDLDGEGEEDAVEEEEEDNDIATDAMIKAKRRTAAAKPQPEAGSSGAKRGKGKGKAK